jgi:putative lipase involved disintegration of autophagic bodies
MASTDSFPHRSVCWCGKRAQCNTRYANGKIVREGAQIILSSNESYVALCRKHYKEGKLWFSGHSDPADIPGTDNPIHRVK